MIVHIVAKHYEKYNDTDNGYWFLGAHTKGLYYYLRSSSDQYRSKILPHHMEKYK